MTGATFLRIVMGALLMTFGLMLVMAKASIVGAVASFVLGGYLLFGRK